MNDSDRRSPGTLGSSVPPQFSPGPGRSTQKKPSKAPLVVFFALLFGALGTAGWFHYQGQNAPPDWLVLSNRHKNPPVDALRVLFVGNDHLRVNSLPEMIQRMVPPGQRPLWVQSVVVPGAGLATHREHAATRQAIASGEWDYVVLQPWSLEPIHPSDAFSEAIIELEKAAIEVGAKPVVVVPWARKSQSLVYAANWVPDEPDALQEALGRATESARKYAIVAPVGDAWRILLRETPDAPLYRDDNRASVAGTYLTAAVFVHLLYERAPDATWLPPGVTPGGAEKLTAAAKQALERWRDRPPRSVDAAAPPDAPTPRADAVVEDAADAARSSNASDAAKR